MRTEQPNVGASVLTLVLGFTGFGLLLLAYAGVGLGSWKALGHWPNSKDVVALLSGTVPWTGWHTAGVAGVAAVAVVVGVITLWLVLRARRGAKSIDGKARVMGRADGLSHAAAVKRCKDGRMYLEGQAPGLMFGRGARNGRELWSYWRDGMVVEMGPGSGKTTGVAIPLIVDAPGVVVATSNKRDLPDGVRGVCETRGTCWVFDPQRIADYTHGAAPTWWWNPLEGITGPVDAASLARVFADASAPPESSKNAYFDTAGPQLLANLILAAAVLGRQLDQVYLWIAAPEKARSEAVKALSDNGFTLPAASLKGACNAAPEERSGLFGTAAAAVAFLTSPAILEWVTDKQTGRPQFNPAIFVRSGHDTLISLSREGVGTAGPLTTALTVAVMTAAERLAQQHPHGRLPVPIVCVLDEVANVCRWAGLPAQFSHYGSAGIFLCAILQNWSQGVSAWKAHGMQQMWDAATIRLVGAGIADRSHLTDVAQLIGKQFTARKSSGTSTGGRSSRSVNTSFDKDLILDVDELAGLPTGRMVVIPTGQFPILARTVPHYQRPGMAGLVHASIARYEPKGAVMGAPIARYEPKDASTEVTT